MVSGTCVKPMGINNTVNNAVNKGINDAVNPRDPGQFFGGFVH